MIRIALVTVGDPHRLTGGYLYHQRLAELAPRHGACIHFVSFPERPFPLALGWGGRVLRKVSERGSQVVLLDSLAAAYLGPWLWAWGKRLPIAAILHQGPGGIGQSWLRTGLQALLDRLAYSRVDRFFVAGQSLLQELPLPASRTYLAVPGCDLNSLPVDPAPDLRRGRQAAILCVANWVPMKDLVSLLQAFEGLPEDLATLHLVGDETADPGYARKVRVALEDLKGRVICHGKQSRERLASLYRGSDFFVLNSLRETYGTVYGEAMASGLPVVGWRAGNLAYLADHEKEGLIVDTGDIVGLRKALLRLASDRDYCQTLGEAALARAQSLPSWEQTTARILEGLKELLA